MIRSIGKRIELFRVIAHPIRMRILNELLRGPQCVNDIVDFLEISQSNVSQHLALLRQTGAVDFLSDGRTKWYYVVDPMIPDIIEILRREYYEDLPLPEIPHRRKVENMAESELEK